MRGIALRVAGREIRDGKYVSPAGGPPAPARLIFSKSNAGTLLESRNAGGRSTFALVTLGTSLHYMNRTRGKVGRKFTLIGRVMEKVSMGYELPSVMKRMIKSIGQLSAECLLFFSHCCGSGEMRKPLFQIEHNFRNVSFFNCRIRSRLCFFG